MSSREHECPRCGDTWHCEGCETGEILKVCNSCRLSLENSAKVLSAPYDFGTLVTHVGDANESEPYND